MPESRLLLWGESGEFAAATPNLEDFYFVVKSIKYNNPKAAAACSRSPSSWVNL
jgi:hypothetical protein